MTQITRVIEKTVNPDKIAAIYEKTKEMVREEYVSRKTLKNNLFESEYIKFQDSSTLDYIYKWAIKINGKVITGETTVNKENMFEDNVTKFFVEKIMETHIESILKALQSN